MLCCVASINDILLYRYTLATGISLLNSTETSIIHMILLVIVLLLVRYTASFASAIVGHIASRAQPV